MHLQPRYARIYTDPGVEEAEANYPYRELEWDIPLQDAAVVCVDCWNWHFSRETLARIEDCTAKNIAPLLAACRAQGLQVIHMPADPVASRHPNLLRPKPADARPQAPWPDTPAWPPAEFKSKTGPYAQFARPVEPQDATRAQHRETQRAFHRLCQPVGNEPVLVDGEDLHRYCAERRLLHLFFIGFNTNACIMMRDYGIPPMAARGYDCILVRDCTTGMEVADTVADLTCTRGTVATIEQFLGYTVTAGQLVNALNTAR
jgi:nicotinamidase-related amidase